MATAVVRGETGAASRVARERSLVLDVLRVGAAIAVFVTHQQQAGGVDLGGLGFNGRLGVYVFFVLSGHLVGGLYRPGHASAYVRHRLARIVPAYYVAVVSIALLTSDADFQRQPVAYLTFTQSWAGPLPFGALHPTWTLVSEMAFYAVVPLVARWPVIAYGLAVPSFALWTIAPELPASSLWAFAIGIGAARLPIAARPALIAGVAYLVIGFGAGWDPLVALGTAGVIRASTLAPIASRPGVALAADLTYAFYLWHTGVLEVLHLSGASLALVAFAATAAISAASLLLVERPILRAVGRRAASPPLPVEVAAPAS